MTSYKRYLCPPLTAGQKNLSFGLAVGLSILLFIGFALFAQPSNGAPFVTEDSIKETIVLPETPSGPEMVQAWQALHDVSAEQLQAWRNSPEQAPPEKFKALQNTIDWALKVEIGDINAGNPYNVDVSSSGGVQQYVGDAIKCNLMQAWLTDNKEHTTQLWSYLSEVLITDSIRTTAENIVATATAPDTVTKVDDFAPYRDFDAFINYLKSPKKLGDCSTKRGVAIIDMLVFNNVPQRALSDVHIILAYRTVRGDALATKYLAWLAQLYYNL